MGIKLPMKTLGIVPTLTMIAALVAVSPRTAPAAGGEAVPGDAETVAPGDGATTAAVLRLPRHDLALALVFVPAGPFLMGSPDGPDNERPIHQVTLDAFWIGRFEVTAGQYAVFLNAVGRDRTPDGILFLDTLWEGALIRRRPDGRFAPRDGFEDFPAVGITWFGARAFCEWVAGESGLPVDLPTEAQWEKAARGGREVPDERGGAGRIFPWGIRLNPTLARYNAQQPTRVGRYPAGVSPYGAFDMAGNAAEWVRDWFDDQYYSISPALNPTGPDGGTLKILRGGDWSCQYVTLGQLRSTYRFPMNPRVGELTMGFRVALNREAPPHAASHPNKPE
ncbi:MAG: hypothetical protein Kow0059_06030 [Candidatus Sumerlaeia bacterium]